MRNGVLGSIAALAAGAGLAFGQGPVPAGGPPAGGYDILVPASGQAVPVPVHLGGVDGPSVIPADAPGPNGAPVYPPPGMYGTVPYPSASASAANHFLAPHWWASAEYLLWWVKSQPTRAPLLTTGARGEGGVIGRPTTRVLVGDCDYGYGLFSGFRVTGGYFKDADRRYGLELSGFLLEQNVVEFFAVSDPNGVPVIARPFVDAGTGSQGVLTVAFPNLASGTALFYTSSQTWGAEGNAVMNLYRTCPDECKLMTIDGLFGFRYMHIHEVIDIASSSTLLGASTTSFAGLQVAAPATINVRDRFETTNQFYGGQFGVRAEARYGKWHTMFVGKIALGDMNQTLLVDGRSEVIDPTRGIAAINPGGLLANGSTICTLRHDEFAYIPEVMFSLGYSWSSCLTTFIGYTATYVSRVIRPGDQITNVVNPAIIPTSPTFGLGGPVATPNVLFTQSEFWMQGVSVGLLVKW
jgi:hypothetical protein